MCALILIFALAMSLIINFIERAIISHNRAIKEAKGEEALVNQEAGITKGKK